MQSYTQSSECTVVARTRKQSLGAEWEVRFSRDREKQVRFVICDRYFYGMGQLKSIRVCCHNCSSHYAGIKRTDPSMSYIHLYSSLCAYCFQMDTRSGIPAGLLRSVKGWQPTGYDFMQTVHFSFYFLNTIEKFLLLKLQIVVCCSSDVGFCVRF